MPERSPQKQGEETHWRLADMSVGSPVIVRPKAGLRLLDLFLCFSLRALLLRGLPALADKLYELHLADRLVEYPFVHANLGPGNRGRVLDVGSYGSALPLELASLGYETYSIDPLGYPLTHPNLTSIRGDICHTDFPEDFFDVVTAVSAIEHVGLGAYRDPVHPEGDRAAIQEIVRILKPGGKAIITVPFGKKTVVCFKGGTPFYRVYDLPSLQSLLSELEVEKAEYALKIAGNWLPASPQEAEPAEGQGVDEGALALLVCRKKK